MSDSSFTSLEDKASYAIGQQVAEHLCGHPFREMNFEAVMAGIADHVNEVQAQVSKADQRDAIEEINQRLMVAQKEAERAGSAEFIAEGEAFLAQNASRPGVTVTASGLQYEVIEEAEGDRPGPASTVRVHYHGTLPDGTVFDSSRQRGEAIEFPVNGVIAGWTEALQMMAVGSRWKLTIPHGLAYGERGAGGTIRPFATLVFDVELIAIV